MNLEPPPSSLAGLRDWAQRVYEKLCSMEPIRVPGMLMRQTPRGISMTPIGVEQSGTPAPSDSVFKGFWDPSLTYAKNDMIIYVDNAATNATGLYQANKATGPSAIPPFSGCADWDIMCTGFSPSFLAVGYALDGGYDQACPIVGSPGGAPVAGMSSAATTGLGGFPFFNLRSGTRAIDLDLNWMTESAYIYPQKITYVADITVGGDGSVHPVYASRWVICSG